MPSLRNLIEKIITNKITIEIKIKYKRSFLYLKIPKIFSIKKIIFKGKVNIENTNINNNISSHVILFIG
jgi:hypothetical protein